jgi:DNA-binding IclR family transcriptional regulator
MVNTIADATTSAPRKPLHSINRAFDVFEYLAANPDGLGVSAIARALDLSKAAVHGIVANLEARHYLERVSGTTRFRLGHKLWELGVLAGENIELRGIARPYLTQLTATSGESSHLTEYDHGEVLYLDKVVSSNPVQAFNRIGGRCPAYCVATGKALLAFQAPEVVDALLARPLARYTRHTITDPGQLRRQLAQVRRRGYAINRGEYRGEIVGVASPVRDRDGRVIAAISISGPAYRFDVARAEAFAAHVMAAAAEISRRLGYSAPSAVRSGSV